MLRIKFFILCVIRLKTDPWNAISTHKMCCTIFPVHTLTMSTVLHLPIDSETELESSCGRCIAI